MEEIQIITFLRVRLLRPTGQQTLGTLCFEFVRFTLDLFVLLSSLYLMTDQIETKTYGKYIFLLQLLIIYLHRVSKKFKHILLG